MQPPLSVVAVRGFPLVLGGATAKRVIAVVFCVMMLLVLSSDVPVVLSGSVGLGLAILVVILFLFPMICASHPCLSSTQVCS